MMSFEQLLRKYKISKLIIDENLMLDSNIIKYIHLPFSEEPIY